MLRFLPQPDQTKGLVPLRSGGYFPKSFGKKKKALPSEIAGRTLEFHQARRECKGACTKAVTDFCFLPLPYFSSKVTALPACGW